MSSFLEKGIDIFSRFPGIGKRVARRFVFFLLVYRRDLLPELIQFLQVLQNNFSRCLFCRRYFENPKREKLCPICQDPKRDPSVLCVVEKDIDLLHLEEQKVFKGFYFVLSHPFYDSLEKKLSDIKVSSLLSRLKNPQKYGVPADFKKVILAINPTVEGKAILKLLLPSLAELQHIEIKLLREGIPRGGELEYADRETLKSALE